QRRHFRLHKGLVHPEDPTPPREAQEDQGHHLRCQPHACARQLRRRLRLGQRTAEPARPPRRRTHQDRRPGPTRVRPAQEDQVCRLRLVPLLRRRQQGPSLGLGPQQLRRDGHSG
ncbi:hypothetical protein LTR16_012247, partial [Cryomyces antarcticus]